MFWHDKLLKKYMRSKGFLSSIDILTKQDIPIRIVLFDNKKHFQRTAAATKDKDSIATYYQSPSELDNEKCFGIMSFCIDHIGAGIVTHEMYHFGEQLQRLGWESEEIATTLQMATIDFWNWWYAVIAPKDKENEMRYTAEQIKPKKYLDEKPSESGFDVQYRVLLDDGRQVLFDWNPVTPSETMVTWDRYVEWFIDIPNPPEELRFLAYPENKPSEDGLYLVHYKPADDWGDIYYPDENIWDEHIDYFIPYRLDEPVSDTDELDEPLGNSEQLESEDEMDVICRSDDTILSSGKDNVVLKNTRNGETDKIVIWKHAFTEICLHWLDLQGENKYKDAIQKIAARIETYDDTGYPRNLANLVEIIEVIVGDCLQDVVKCGEAISSDKYDYKFALERIRTWTCNDGRGHEDPAALLENIDDYINKVLDVVKRDKLLPEAPCKNCQRTATDYENLRLAGDRLALASMRVVKDYDGIHRLRFAIGEWEKAIAGEGGRDEDGNVLPRKEK